MKQTIYLIAIIALLASCKQNTVNTTEEVVENVEEETVEATEEVVENVEEAIEYVGDFEEEQNPTISEMEALCYFLKIYNLDPDYNNRTGNVDDNYRKITRNSFGSYGLADTWTKKFLERTNYDYYRQICDDEFKYAKVLNTTSEELRSMIKSLDFKSQYSAVFRANFGEYNFNTKSFPVKFDVTNTGALFSMFDGKYSPSKPVVSISKILNYNQFDNVNDYNFRLSMNETDAEKLIDSRKRSDGYVDRTVFIKIIYSVANMQVENNSNSAFHKSSYLAVNASDMEVWGDQYCFQDYIGQIRKL